jgi:hypothetical protein
MKFLIFSILWIIFALLDPDPESGIRIRIWNPNPESESESGIRIRNPNPNLESESGIRIRNLNPESESESGIRIRNPNPESESGIQNPNPNPDPLIWLNLDPKHCFFGWNNYFSANNWKESCCKMRKSCEKIQMAFNFVTVLIYHVHSHCKGCLISSYKIQVQNHKKKIRLVWWQKKLIFFLKLKYTRCCVTTVYLDWGKSLFQASSRIIVKSEKFKKKFWCWKKTSLY